MHPFAVNLNLTYAKARGAHSVCLQALRERVRRGAKEHPGAVAVEDERGRVVSLARLPPTRRDALAKCAAAGLPSSCLRSCSSSRTAEDPGPEHSRCETWQGVSW